MLPCNQLLGSSFNCQYHVRIHSRTVNIQQRYDHAKRSYSRLGKIKLLKSNAAIESIVRENASRLSHNYTVGDKVSILISRDEVKSNTDQPTEGSFDIVKVYPSHGTVKIQTGIYQEVIQIRRLKPYHE